MEATITCRICEDSGSYKLGWDLFTMPNGEQFNLCDECLDLIQEQRKSTYVNKQK